MKRISRVDEAKTARHSSHMRSGRICSLRHLSSGCRRLRFLLRSVWTDGQPDPDDHPDRSQARLLFPVALRFAFAASSLAGDAIPSHRPGYGSWRDSSAVSFRRRRKELEAPAHCGSHGAADRDHPRNFHSAAQFAPWSPQMNAWSGDPVPDGTCMGPLRSSGRARWCFRSSSAATATPSARPAERGAGLGPRRRAAHAGPTHPAGDSGRRQHACLWKKLESG